MRLIKWRLFRHIISLLFNQLEKILMTMNHRNLQAILLQRLSEVFGKCKKSRLRLDLKR